MPFVVAHGQLLWQVALALCLIAGPLVASRWRKLRGRRARALGIGVGVGLAVWALGFVALPIAALALVSADSAELGIAVDPDSGLGVATPWPEDARLGFAQLAAMGPFSRSTYLRERTWTIRAPGDPRAARALGDSVAELGGRCDLLAQHAVEARDEERALSIARTCDDARARRVAATIHFGHGQLRAASDDLATARASAEESGGDWGALALFAARCHLAAGQPRRAIDALAPEGIAGRAREPALCVRAALMAQAGDAGARAELREAAAGSAACAVLAASSATGAERERLLRLARGSPFEYAAWLLRLETGAVPADDILALRIRSAHPVLLDAFAAQRGIPALEARALRALDRAGDSAATRSARARLDTELAVAAISSGRDDEARRSAARAVAALGPMAGAAAELDASSRYERAVAIEAAIHARAGSPEDAERILASLPDESPARVIAQDSLAWLASGARPRAATARRSWVGARESTLWYAARAAPSDSAFAQRIRRVCGARLTTPMPHLACPAPDELREDWASRGAETRCRTCALGRMVTDYTFRVDAARRVGVAVDERRFEAERDKLRAAWLDPRFALAVVVLEASDPMAEDPLGPTPRASSPDRQDPWECPAPADCRN